jgi:hypothetical protein
VTTPEAIVPDTKDWTWVLERPCEQCGFDTRTVRREDVPALLRATAEAWLPVLSRPDARDRPRPDVWSALEYGCHTRDVYRVFATRLASMLAEDSPHFDNWDQDATAVAERYSEQDPAVVASELGDAAESLAESFGAVRDDQWGRTGLRSDGAAFTVETLARYLLHDPVHHLWDVGAPLEWAAS